MTKEELDWLEYKSVACLDGFHMKCNHEHIPCDCDCHAPNKSREERILHNHQSYLARNDAI